MITVTTLTPFPFSIPEHFTRECGYDNFLSSFQIRRFVGLHWEQCGDELAWSDGRIAYCGAPWHAWSNLMHHPFNPYAEGGRPFLPVWWLQDHHVDLGASDSSATHWLVIDRETNRGYVAPVELARRIVESQSLDVETMSGRVVHVNDNVEGAIYIGRAMRRRGLAGSPFGNPFPVGHDPDHTQRAGAIASFRRHLMASPELLRALPDLRGKPLACWCRYDGTPRKPKNACHGDVLLELLETYTDEQLREMGG